MFSQRMEKHNDVQRVVIRQATSDAVRDMAIEVRDKLNCESARIFIVDNDIGQVCLPAAMERDSIYHHLSMGIVGKVARSGESLNLRCAFDSRWRKYTSSWGSFTLH